MTRRRAQPEREPVSIDRCRGVRTTPKALFVALDETDDREAREVWVPLSIIDEESEVWGVGDEGTLVVPAWFAEKEGLE